MLSTDPIDLALDPVTGGLAFGPDGAPYFLTGADAVAQLCDIACNFIRGEWFLDQDRGIPYFARDNVTEDEALLANRFDEFRARAAYHAALVVVPGVAEVVSVSATFDPTSRTVTVEWSVRLAFDDTPLIDGSTEVSV